MDRGRLPVGIQTFRRIREEGYYYVDKIGVEISAGQRDVTAFDAAPG